MKCCKKGADDSWGERPAGSAFEGAGWKGLKVDRSHMPIADDVLVRDDLKEKVQVAWSPTREKT